MSRTRSLGRVTVTRSKLGISYSQYDHTAMAQRNKRPSWRSDAHGGAFLENRRGAGNLARSRLSGGSWAMSEPSWPAEGRLKAGCSQDWLPHKAARIFIISCDAAGVMSSLCHLLTPIPAHGVPGRVNEIGRAHV